MNVKKIGVTAAVVSTLLMVSSQSAIAAKDDTRPTATVQGTVNVVENCAISANLESSSVDLNGQTIAGGNKISNLNITPSCSGTVYTQFQDRDSAGYGIATSDTGDSLGVAFQSTNPWTWRSTDQLQTAPATENVSMSTQIQVASGGEHVPTAGAVKAGSYTYTVNVGYWTN
ncbi:hypothetical protein H5963_24795 [Escherichia coli]|uniref:hypothetical protein n=1 Tax=Escherichia coli TaxID=562 RepID=UPI00069BF791|nr:hypothetical protein [Escherichia coli]EGO9689485.1 hypothetical protein [Escherichia coli]EHK9947363.1 hypothetical protein [Escherichia coli]KOA25609.1 hypothetical protein AC067_26080 [Escherichia coli]MBZ8707414.1 hypothetical protein [Escherichia coli]